MQAIKAPDVPPFPHGTCESQAMVLNDLMDTCSGSSGPTAQCLDISEIGATDLLGAANDADCAVMAATLNEAAIEFSKQYVNVYCLGPVLVLDQGDDCADGVAILNDMMAAYHSGAFGGCSNTFVGAFACSTNPTFSAFAGSRGPIISSSLDVCNDQVVTINHLLERCDAEHDVARDLCGLHRPAHADQLVDVPVEFVDTCDTLSDHRDDCELCFGIGSACCNDLAACNACAATTTAPVPATPELKCGADLTEDALLYAATASECAAIAALLNLAQEKFAGTGLEQYGCFGGVLTTLQAGCDATAARFNDMLESYLNVNGDVYKM